MDILSRITTCTLFIIRSSHSVLRIDQFSKLEKDGTSHLRLYRKNPSSYSLMSAEYRVLNPDKLFASIVVSIDVPWNLARHITWLVKVWPGCFHSHGLCDTGHGIRIINLCNFNSHMHRILFCYLSRFVWQDRLIAICICSCSVLLYEYIYYCIYLWFEYLCLVLHRFRFEEFSCHGSRCCYSLF